MLSPDLIRPCARRAMQHYGQEPINVSYRLARFGDHRHCGSEDIKILVCQVISQDHLIKWSFDFIGRSPSSYHPAKFCGYRHCGSGDIMVLVCQVISQDHSIKG